jgi:hypothetical protein
VLAASLLLTAGCQQQAGGDVAASSISRDGFALDGAALRRLDGQEIKLWGYVDHGNLYGDAGARAILQEWWSGDGPNAKTWRFNVKANADDEAGRSFAVHVPNDSGRDPLLTRFLADARTGRPTKVFVKGKLLTFDAPTSGTLLTGLIVEPSSSRDILLEAPQGQ